MDFLGYGNHVALYSEEISRGGEGLGVSDSSIPIRFENSGRYPINDNNLIEYSTSFLSCHTYLRCVQLGSRAWKSLMGGDREKVQDGIESRRELMDVKQKKV